MALEIGQVAPDFELRDQHGQSVSLSSLRGSKAVVLIFYPFAFSSVCTGELHDIRDNLTAFDSVDVQLLAVSCDPMYSLRAFADNDRLTFPLLSDFWPHGEVSAAFGVFNHTRGCSSRSTFIIDKEGLVRWTMHHSLPDARDMSEYARVVSELQDVRPDR